MRRPRPAVVVTGGAGFIGSHLVDRLLCEGSRVLVIDDLSTGTIENVNPGAAVEVIDITRADLEGLFRSFRPHVVYHLAAQSRVPVSDRRPLHDLEVNVVGTHRVASAARACSAQRIVFTSSGGAVYGETSTPATERTRPAPRSYYGVHKLAAEGHIACTGLPHAIARPSNVYGPRQVGGADGAVVVAFLEQAVRDGALQIHGDGHQTRDFVHVDDAVDALLRLGHPDAQSGIWNVASGRRVTILELAVLVERAVGPPLARVYLPLRSGDVAHSAISAARLRTLGWKPTVSLVTGVAGLVQPTRAPDA